MANEKLRDMKKVAKQYGAKAKKATSRPPLPLMSDSQAQVKKKLDALSKYYMNRGSGSSASDRKSKKPQRRFS